MLLSVTCIGPGRGIATARRRALDAPQGQVGTSERILAIELIPDNPLNLGIICRFEEKICGAETDTLGFLIFSFLRVSVSHESGYSLLLKIHRRARHANDKVYHECNAGPAQAISVSSQKRDFA